MNDELKDNLIALALKLLEIEEAYAKIRCIEETIKTLGEDFIEKRNSVYPKFIDLMGMDDEEIHYKNHIIKYFSLGGSVFVDDKHI